MVIKYIRKLLGSRKKASAERASDPHPGAGALPHQPQVHHRPISNSLIDPEAAKIIKRLRRFGHTAYIVGGGVRDLLLERTPKDFDIGTSARPNEVRKLFRNCRIIGRRFRLAHIYFHDKIIEVATFRSNQPEDLAAAEEIAAAEARAAGAAAAGDRKAAERELAPREEGDVLIRSDNVFGTPETDALRRDFTINALFYDIESGDVIDYVGGIADLDAHLLRMIGDPEVRLREDPIRILRAIRLAGRLQFTIDPGTLSALRRHKLDIHRAAAPRILEDLLRMFRKGGAERAMRLMHEHGIDEVVMPELLAAAKPGDFELQLKCLHSLDLATARGTEFSNATLLSLVFYPYARRALESADLDGGPRAFQAIDKIVGGFEQRLVVPKRDRDRIRQILLAQKRFMGGRSGARGASGAFVRKPFFPEAFDLFDIVTSATGEHRDEVRRWKGRITSAAAASDGDSLGPQLPRHAPREEDRAGGRRRRRGRAGQGDGGRQPLPAGGGGNRSRDDEIIEPLTIPELAPGENPYGDAIAVTIPAGAPHHAHAHAPAPSYRDSRREGAARDRSLVTAGSEGPRDGAGASVAPSSAHDGEASNGAASPQGRKRRRRRGGRGRKNRGPGGSGNPASDL